MQQYQKETWGALRHHAKAMREEAAALASRANQLNMFAADYERLADEHDIPAAHQAPADGGDPLTDQPGARELEAARRGLPPGLNTAALSDPGNGVPGWQH